MAVDKPNTSPPGLRLGRELKRLREAAGYDGRKGAERIAAETGISPATIYRAEKGEGVKKERDIRALLDLYRASTERSAALMELVSQTRTPGWWAEYDIPVHLGLYLGMEQVAAEIWWFEPLLIPGLLQTEDYARTIITAGRSGADDPEVTAKIRFRMERQAILLRSERPPALHVAVGEEALRRPIGSAAIHAAQLERLLQATDLPNVSVHVVPIAVGFYRGVSTGPFEVLHFPPDSDGVVYEPPTVYAELFTSGGYFDDPAEVSRYTAAFEDIRNRALDEADSEALIKRAVEALQP
ncbi:MAG TPA: helix-turn-helix transcriptional regulator [Trebonia sp.]|nr:helix-turn-helix transcriptional regulator [Trebonia sp.]